MGSESETPQPQGNRKPQQVKPQQNTTSQQPDNQALQQQVMALTQQLQTMEKQQAPTGGQPQVAGGRIAPIRQSRIVDRPQSEGAKNSSLKIQIELDLEVEVEIYARVKGDIQLGLL